MEALYCQKITCFLIEHHHTMKYLLHNISTKRLHFRPVEKDDFDAWLDLFDSKATATFLGFDPNLSKHELCQTWFDKVFNRYENGLGGMNVLIDKASNLMVGQCGLLIQTVEGVERMEIGYSILPQYRNKGYASEAAQKCKNYAFENDWRDQLISIIHVDNIGSEKVAIRNGMSLEKRIDDYHGNPVNVFRINQSDWKQQ